MSDHIGMKGFYLLANGKKSTSIVSHTFGENQFYIDQMNVSKTPKGSLQTNLVFSSKISDVLHNQGEENVAARAYAAAAVNLFKEIKEKPGFNEENQDGICRVTLTYNRTNPQDILKAVHNVFEKSPEQSQQAVNSKLMSDDEYQNILLNLTNALDQFPNILPQEQEENQEFIAY